MTLAAEKNRLWNRGKAMRPRSLRAAPLGSLASLALKRLRNIDASSLGRDALAGFISAVGGIAYCLSLSALIFQGEIVGGFALGLAALIMGTVVTRLVVALTSTLSPADAEPDDPAVAVMSVLAASVAAALAAKGASNQAVIINVLVAISVSTLFTGILLFGLGALRLGQWLRFVPYPVIGGFFAASGLVLITGGAEVVTQTSLTLAPSGWAVLYSSLYAPQIGVGFLFVLSISSTRYAALGSCRATASSLCGGQSLPSHAAKSIGA
jgi:sulfate permease, SulP family